MALFNALGQEIKTLVNAQQGAGAYAITWDGTTSYGIPAASGVYHVRMRAGAYTKAVKLLLIR